MKTTKKIQFSKILLRWNKEQNKRQMPWKGEKDPYKIWLSEIILQQTRVEQGLKYYKNFISTFPTIHKLAKAPEQKIYKLWEGLGYYTRCRNLILTARYVSKELNGRFPDNYEDIKKLKGIGPYTGAAIASFAFNQPYAVVDGNVFRVLARIFGVDLPIDSTEGKKFFAHLSNELLDKKSPGLYNQAIMDFGAVICKPAPLCRECPFNKNCQALLEDRISSLPVKRKKTVVQKRWFNYIILEHKKKFAIRQRKEKDIWHNLFEFLLIESGSSSQKEILKQAEKSNWITKNSYDIMETSPIFRQQLSHQYIQGRFIKLKLDQKPMSLPGIFWVDEKEIKSYPFPKIINEYMRVK